MSAPNKRERELMETAIEVMNNSINEPRNDGKESPKVGAVLLKPDGTIETASRGELRYGDHAEFTLLERKNRSQRLDGCILFATLEPCAPGARKHPKLGCAERIVNARISEVWVGIEDPDPDVDRKGIKYLEDNGIKVKMFPPDLQKKIKEANKAFLKQALQRANDRVEKKEIILSKMESTFPAADKGMFSEDAIKLYLSKAGLDIVPFSKEFWAHFENIGLVEAVKVNEDVVYKPTGFGIILFGKRPRDTYPQSVLKAKVKYGTNESSPSDFDQPLVMIPYEVEKWLEKVLHSTANREGFVRTTSTDFPIQPLREAIINALVHRDYEQAGAKTYLEIDDDKIVVKSAGLPVEPITLDEVKRFEASTLSRNPKITYIFNQMGLMEEAELGMETFRNMQRAYNLPLPVYDYKAPYLTLTFSRSIEAVRKVSGIAALEELNGEELNGYEWIRSQASEGVSKKEYAVRFNIDDKKAQRHLAKMKKLKLLGDNGEKSNSPNFRYIAMDY